MECVWGGGGGGAFIDKSWQSLSFRPGGGGRGSKGKGFGALRRREANVVFLPLQFAGVSNALVSSTLYYVCKSYIHSLFVLFNLTLTDICDLNGYILKWICDAYLITQPSGQGKGLLSA